MAAECPTTGKEMLVTSEHALHEIEIITAARESSRSGKRVELTSTFQWPVVV
jgi:predicted dehydrogenase